MTTVTTIKDGGDASAKDAIGDWFKDISEFGGGQIYILVGLDARASYALVDPQSGLSYADHPAHIDLQDAFAGDRKDFIRLNKVEVVV